MTWTDDMAGEFRKHRGYDLTRYLPVLTGRVIDSADVSERFLWDFRRTIADLLAENHYATATQYFHKSGVGLYAEAMGSGLPTVGDGLLNKGQVDIPMGEFWTTLPTQPDTQIIRRMCVRLRPPPTFMASRLWPRNRSLPCRTSLHGASLLFI